MEFGRAGRVFWPEDGTRFAAIGGFVGLASDFASFLGNLGSPKWLFWPALLGVVLLLVVCWRRVFDSKATDTPDKLAGANEEAISLIQRLNRQKKVTDRSVQDDIELADIDGRLDRLRINVEAILAVTPETDRARCLLQSIDGA